MEYAHNTLFSSSLPTTEEDPVDLPPFFYSTILLGRWLPSYIGLGYFPVKSYDPPKASRALKSR